MMICAADFAKQAPALSPPKQRGVAAATPTSPSEACIARWEDDGGRICTDASHRTSANARPMHDHDRISGPTGADIAFATMPAAAAYGAAWVMLAT